MRDGSPKERMQKVIADLFSLAVDVSEIQTQNEYLVKENNELRHKVDTLTTATPVLKLPSWAINAVAEATWNQVKDKPEYVQYPRIAAIKLLREIAGLDLRTAKDLIDRIAEPTDSLAGIYAPGTK